MASDRCSRRAMLQELLAAELTRLMSAEGWSIDPAREYGPDSPTIAAFRRPVAPNFAATAAFERPSSLWDRPPLSVLAVVGVSFEPLYRLWPLLADRVSFGECFGRAGTPRHGLDVEKPEQVPDAARQLVELATARAVAFARRHASVEALLEANRGDPDRFDHEIRLVPALLAAAGRHEEARAALAEYQASGREETRRPEFRRFTRLLTRWLDAGGVIPDPPTAPPVHEPLPQRPRVRQSWREDRARDRALAAVAKAGRGKSREQLREMLTRELAARHVSMAPVAVEHALDGMQIRLRPFGRVRAALWSLAHLRAAGVGIVNAIRAGPGAEPDWLRPPARAGYRLHPAHSSVAVSLDPGATSWLDRAHAGAVRRFGDTVQLHAWLDWDTADPGRLAVHIADHRVGVLDAASTRLYRPAMERAATRAEVPHLHAELTRRGPRYLLQIAAPAQDPASGTGEG